VNGREKKEADHAGQMKLVIRSTLRAQHSARLEEEDRINAWCINSMMIPK
jgi:hypothetical protein